MKALTQTDFEFLPVVPIDDDTRAMLAYAASPEGAARAYLAVIDHMPETVLAALRAERDRAVAEA
jgi:hypothetical protein